MDDRFIKYTKLSVIIFLLFLAIPLSFSLLFGVFYGFSAIISSGPVDILFEIFIVSLPAVLFCTVYAIFYTRTKSHPSKAVRYISNFFFALCTIISLYALITDLLTYFHIHLRDITGYQCFTVWFLAGNISTIFLIGVVQAFTTKKEKDWMDKAKERAISKN